MKVRKKAMMETVGLCPSFCDEPATPFRTEKVQAEFTNLRSCTRGVR